jgi:hypothetical protein
MNKLRKPRLTNRILEAIEDALIRIEAGDVESTFSYDEPETRKQFNDCMDALSWVRNMKNYRRKRAAMK